MSEAVEECTLSVIASSGSLLAVQLLRNKMPKLVDKGIKQCSFAERLTASDLVSLPVSHQSHVECC